jgi:hypothetical protein
MNMIYYLNVINNIRHRLRRGVISRSDLRSRNGCLKITSCHLASLRSSQVSTKVSSAPENIPCHFASGRNEFNPKTRRRTSQIKKLPLREIISVSEITCCAIIFLLFRLNFLEFLTWKSFSCDEFRLVTISTRSCRLVECVEDAWESL